MSRLYRIVFSLLAAFFAAAIALAATARYRIELTDGSRILSVDRPVPHGTVLTFHSHPGGQLTGVPAEMVLRVVSDRPAPEPATMTVRSTRLTGGPLDRPAAGVSEGGSLEPGEILVLGPTGDGIAPAGAANAASAAADGSSAGMPVGVGGAYGGALIPNVVNPNAVVNPVNPNTALIGTDGLPRVPSSTDLSRAQSPQPTIGSKGFPVTSNAAPTVIGPNGTPTLAPGVPGSGTMVIGPNGTPVTASGTTPVVIGPNGTPVLAPSGQAGSAQPVIGPSGTPVLAQPGQPGAAQPVIGPNGTPVLAQPGQPGSAPPVIGPNGTPVLAPSGQPGGAAPPGPPGGASASPGSGS
jgi:hypothetical protein